VQDAVPELWEEVFALKLRIKFSKTDSMQYIGHLDIMRYFQKAMRRADIPIKYSEGFSPHQIMSFAAPLGLGLESMGEYFDIALAENASITTEEVKNRLNAVMCPGMGIVDVRELPDDAKNAMASVAAAYYEIYGTGLTPEAVSSIYNSASIPGSKVTKSGETVNMDLKPLIYELKMKDEVLCMKVSQGSENNLKPETVLNAMGINDCSELRIVRTEIYNHDGLTL